MHLLIKSAGPFFVRNYTNAQRMQPIKLLQNNMEDRMSKSHKHSSKSSVSLSLGLLNAEKEISFLLLLIIIIFVIY